MNKYTRILSILVLALLTIVMPATAQTDDNKNKAIVETTDGTQQLNTDEISIIRFEGDKVTFVQPWGESVFDRTLRSLTFLRPLPGTLRLTVQAGINENKSNRAQEIDTYGKLKTTWESGDVVYVYADASSTTSIGTLTPASEDYGKSSATLEGNITGTGLGDGSTTLYFSTQPRATYSLATQDGTVENLFYCTASASATITGGNATISGNLSFTRPFAVVKFSLMDKGNGDAAISASELQVTVNSTTYTVTPSPAASDIFVGIPNFSGKTVNLTANVGTSLGASVYTYEKDNVSFSVNKYYAINVKMNFDHQIVNLAALTANYEAQDKDVLTGTLAGKRKISIAAGATVTLDGVTINGVDDYVSEWAGITCKGNATIILSGTNTVKGFTDNFPGVRAAHNNTGVGDEYTLTIQGTGSLNASSNGHGVGIGGGTNIDCGNIVINGGNIVATGGYQAAGIGSGCNSSCGDITISGGSVTATGGDHAAGIGGGYEGTCGTITITNTVTSVTAIKGSGATNSIGAGGDNNNCGKVTIGGVEGAISDMKADFSSDQYTFTLPAGLTFPIALSAVTSDYVSCVITSDGYVYATVDDATADGKTAVAIITYVGDAGTADASSSSYKGLALALTNANSGNQTVWCSQHSETCLTTQYAAISSEFNDMAGIANTDALVGHATHTHAAANAARSNNSTAHPTGTSDWFLPSAGQWQKMVNAAGSHVNLRTFASLWTNTYWTSTEHDAFNAYSRDFNNNSSSIAFKDEGSFYVRACLAF